MTDVSVEKSDSPQVKEGAGASTEKKERREIPGGFSYTTSHGVFQKVLQRLIHSERPTHFGADFMTTVLQASGGSARAIPPILKRAGFLSADGVPTDRYAQFQSDTKRPTASLEALKAGWPELFRRNSYAHKLEGAALEDLFKEITGLQKNDVVFKAIVATYRALQEYAKGAPEAEREGQPDPGPLQRIDSPPANEERSAERTAITLANQITIVLPATTDITIYNAIFRSLRENLL